MTLERAGSCLRRNDGKGRRNDGMEWVWARRDTCGERGRAKVGEGLFGVVLIGRILGDPEGAPIWSGRLAAFRFVQVCSDLFRVVQG